MTALTPEARVRLLALARDALIAHFDGVTHAAPDATDPLATSRAAFVTLRVAGRLRGCVGALDSDRLLPQAVGELAVLAATNDPRFAPLRREELSAVRVEVSVLSEARPSRPEDIVIGEHGIIVERDARRALLLPQVATEHALTREAFLAACCEKAGLGAAAWRDERCRLLTFTAEVFGEPE